MPKKHLAVYLAATALILSACADKEVREKAEAPEKFVTVSTSTTPPVTTPTQKEGVEIFTENSVTHEPIAKYLFTGKEEVRCAGRQMLMLTFDVSADKDSSTAPNYSFAQWKALKNNGELDSAGATVEAARCTPAEFQSMEIAPGQTVENIQVVLDTTGADTLEYHGTGMATPLRLSL